RSGSRNARNFGPDAHALRTRDYRRRADVAIFFRGVEGRQTAVSRRGDSEREQEPATAANASAAEAGTNDNAPAESASVPELEKLVAEKTDMRNALVRLQADFENYRKRIERE